MRKIIVALFIFFIGLSLGAQANMPKENRLASLKDWIGKYSDEPFMKDGPLHGEAVQKRLSALMGPTILRTFMEKWLVGVVFPVEESKKVLFFHYCLPHHCPESFLWLYMDPQEDVIEACYKVEGKRTIFASEKTQPRYHSVDRCPYLDSSDREE